MAVSKKGGMSVSILPETHSKLKYIAKSKGLTTSAFCMNLIEQALLIRAEDEAKVIGVPADEDVTTVVWRVPKKLRGDQELLKQWVLKQAELMADALYKPVAE